MKPTQEQVIAWAREAGFDEYETTSLSGNSELDRTLQVNEYPVGESVFALVALAYEAGRTAEREKVAAWMIQRSYATGHGDTTEDLLAELDWQIAENWNRAMINGIEAGRKDENEACAEVCEEYQDAVDRHRWPNGYDCAAAIRARREQ